MLRFESPYYFLLLSAIPAAVIFHRNRRTHPAMGVPGLSTVMHVKFSAALKLRWIMPFLKYAVFGLLVIAMARPQHGTQHMSILTEGINIMLAVDLSESMAALDFKRDDKIVNRLEAAKGVIRGFISKRTGDRIGMVVFGSEAYTQLPLTRDYSTIATILDNLEIGAAGKSTALGDALGISLKRLEDIKSQSNVIILLTDGQSNAGELAPQLASEIASEKGVKVYTIGVGTKGRAPFLVNHPVFGKRYVHQQVNIDENTLKDIAAKTGGLYFRAENTEGLKEIYDTIDKMEKTDVKVKTFADYKELYSYFLIPAFMLLVVWIVLSNTRYLRVP